MKISIYKSLLAILTLWFFVSSGPGLTRRIFRLISA